MKTSKQIIFSLSVLVNLSSYSSAFAYEAKFDPKERASINNNDISGTALKSDNIGEYFKVGDSRYIKYHNPQAKLEPNSKQILSEGATGFWAGVLELYSDGTAPAKPNCSERSFNEQDYLKIVNDPTVKSKNDFLKRIPMDSLQKFTFIHKSESLQKEGVNKAHPRVMRFSTDGKFVMTYTCAPKGPTSDTVEVMYFDEKSRRYNFIHTDFATNTEDAIRKAHGKNTQINPRACFACHGGSDPKPNWQGYPQWDGVYGADDDSMAKIVGSEYKVGGTYDIDVYNSASPKMAKETYEYVKMRKDLQDDPCISTLPWPNKTSEAYWHYPYTPFYKVMNYNYRPNAHFTIAQARLNAQRLARKFEEHPLWNNIKWQTVAKVMNCENTPSSDVMDDIESASKKRRIENNDEYRESSYDDTGLLSGISAGLGFYGSDWTLEFSRSPQENLSRGYSTAQWSMEDFTFSVLFRDLTKELPALKYYDVRWNRMSNLFGNKFMCMDEVADKLWVTNESRNEICKLIEPKVREEVRRSVPSYKWNGQRETREGQERKSVVGWGGSSAEKGRQVGMQTCAQCHNGQVLPLNFLNETELKQELKVRPELRKLIEEKTGTEEKCQMPMALGGPCLTSKEKDSLMQYIDSVKGR